MRNSKLISLLKTFSKQEMKDFGKFISSTYFNKGRNLKPLYRILKSFYPEYCSPKLNEEFICKKIIKGKDFNSDKSKHTIKVMISELGKLADKFIVINSFSDEIKSRITFNTYIALNYSDRNLHDLSFRSSIKTRNYIKKLIRQSGTFDLNVYINSLELDSLIRIYGDYKNIKKYNIECNKHFVLLLFTHLFEVVSSEINNINSSNLMLKASTSILDVYRSIISNFDIEAFKLSVEDDGSGIKKIAILRYLVCKAYLESNSNESTNEYLEFFYSNYDYLPHSLKYSSYVALNNIQRYKALTIDYDYFSAQVNKLIDFAWSRGCFSYDENKGITLTGFIAALDVKFYFLEVKEFKEFIDKYILFVDAESRDIAKDFAYAFYYFKNNDFEKALEIISRMKLTIKIFGIKLTILKLMCLYELGLYVECEYSVISLEHLFKNLKIGQENIKQLCIVINCFKFLINLKNHYNNKTALKLCKLTNEIKTCWKGWVKVKAEELNIVNQFN